MATPSFTVTCTQNRQIIRDVYELKFTKPEEFTFKPGQFVLLDVPLIESPEDIQTRAYSIASTPEEDELHFVIRIKPEGRAGQWISMKLREGDAVRIRGPLGVFVLNDERDRDFLFVATGVGLAPFRPQILSLLKEGAGRKIDLVAGFFSEEDILWQNEFRTLEASYENFRFHPTLSDPSLKWKGHTGWVQTVIPKIEDFEKRSIFVCGNPNMTKDVKRLCEEEWRIPKEQVHVEGYI